MMGRLQKDIAVVATRVKGMHHNQARSQDLKKGGAILKE